MAQINEVKMSGRVFRPEFKYSAGGSPFLKFSLKQSRKDKKTQEWVSSWFPVVAFGDVAESGKSLCEKVEVTVDGRLDYNERDVDGKKVVTYRVIANHIVGASEEKQAAKPPYDSEDVPF